MTAILLGVAVLNETVEIRHLTGMALISLGLAAIDGRPWQRLRCSHRHMTPQAAIRTMPTLSAPPTRLVLDLVVATMSSTSS